MNNNYDWLLNIKSKNFRFFIIVPVLIAIIVVYMIKCDTYDKYGAMGVFEENFLIIQLPIDATEFVTNGDYLKINDKEYSYKIEEVSQMSYDYTLNVNYQIVKLAIADLKLLENEAVKVTFYYNKEKIINKVISLVKE